MSMDDAIRSFNTTYGHPHNQNLSRRPTPMGKHECKAVMARHTNVGMGLYGKGEIHLKKCVR